MIQPRQPAISGEGESSPSFHLRVRNESVVKNRQKYLLTQEDSQHLRQGHPRPIIQFIELEAAQWMGNGDKGIVWHAQNLGHALSCRYEGLCADYCGGNSQSLEGNTVVQTARRTGSSIPVGGYDHIAEGSHLLHRILGTGP